MKLQKPKLLRWKLGLAFAVVMLASGGLVLAQQPTTTPAPPTPAVETPPQEPAPKDLPPTPADKGPAIVAPATNAAPPIKAPDDDQDDNDDSDKTSKDDNGSKAADSSAAVPETPGVRTRHSAAIIQALDKVTAETMRFEAPIGKPIRYKGLVFTVRSCETSAPEELVQTPSPMCRCAPSRRCSRARRPRTRCSPAGCSRVRPASMRSSTRSTTPG